MSREKAAKLMAMSDRERAVWRSQRNQRSYWQKLSHDEWVAFCADMAGWFTNEAPDQWDRQVIANNARKAASDAAALEAKVAAEGGARR